MAAPELGAPTGLSRARRHVVSLAGKAAPRCALGSSAPHSRRHDSPQPSPRADAISPVWSHCSTSRCLARNRARAPSGHRLRLVLATNQRTLHRPPHPVNVAAPFLRGTALDIRAIATSMPAAASRRPPSVVAGARVPPSPVSRARPMLSRRTARPGRLLFALAAFPRR
jgi:hypothetical protein